MIRFLLLAALAGSVGCTGIQGTGPFFKSAPPAAAPDAPPAEAKAPAPALTAGGRPVPPAILITPGEVAPDTAAAAITKLGNEIEYDLKNTPPAAPAPIISRYKNGEKVQ